MVNRRTVLKGAIGAVVVGLVPAAVFGSEPLKDAKTIYWVKRGDKRLFVINENRKHTVSLIKENIEQFLRAFAMFEPNDKITRHAVTELLSANMDKWVEERVVSEYNVICNECNNTPEMIDRNLLIVDVAVKLGKDPGFVNIRTILGSQGFEIANQFQSVGA